MPKVVLSEQTLPGFEYKQPEEQMKVKYDYYCVFFVTG